MWKWHVEVLDFWGGSSCVEVTSGSDVLKWRVCGSNSYSFDFKISAADCEADPYMYFTDIGYSKYDEWIHKEISKATETHIKKYNAKMQKSKRSIDELWKIKCK